MSEEKPAATSGQAGPPRAAEAPERRSTVEDHIERRGLGAFDAALVRAHKRYPVGLVVSDADFDAALAEARGITLR
jgi:hypothetical protein